MFSGAKRLLKTHLKKLKNSPRILGKLNCYEEFYFLLDGGLTAKLFDNAFHIDSLKNH
jgi:hypothetical protein